MSRWTNYSQSFSSFPAEVKAAYLAMAQTQGDPRLTLIQRAEQLAMQDHLKPTHKVQLATDPEGRLFVNIAPELVDGTTSTEWTGVLIPVPNQQVERFAHMPGAWLAFTCGTRPGKCYLPMDYRLVWLEGGAIKTDFLGRAVAVLNSKNALLVGTLDTEGNLWASYVQPEIAPGRFSFSA